MNSLARVLAPGARWLEAAVQHGDLDLRRAHMGVFDGKPTRTAGSASDRGPAAARQLLVTAPGDWSVRVGLVRDAHPVRQLVHHARGHPADRLA